MATNDYICHFGVKGMRWGVRRYQNEDGSLTDRGIKKYAKKGYSQDAYRSNKSRFGKAYDRVTGAHKIAGDMQYAVSSKDENRKRAEQYISPAAKRERASARGRVLKKVGRFARTATVASIGAGAGLAAVKEGNIFFAGATAIAGMNAAMFVNSIGRDEDND